MNELIDGLLVFLIYIGPFLLLLGVGGLIADHILPRIPAFRRFLDSLPDWDDE